MRVAIQNFTGGEISPILSARYDLARYRNSVACMENMLPGLHGDVRRRPGMRFVAALDGDSVLLPFSFSAEAGQNFVLVFGNGTLRVAGSNGFDASAGDAVLSTPYTGGELLHLSSAQVGDTVYLAHNAHPLHKLIRRDSLPAGMSGICCHGYVWTLEKVALNTSLAAPARPTVTFSGEGGSYTLRYRVAAVDSSGNISLASATGECANARHPSDWVQGNCATLSWQAVSGAVEYNVYREEAGYYGFIGIARGTSFIDNNYQADTSDTPREDWDPFAGNNHPGVVAFHQQRMVLAGTRKQPQAFYLSRSGDFENFRKSRPLQDDDPLEYLIASGSIDAIAWAASFGDLLIGTSGSEYKAASGDGGPLTPSSIGITVQSSWGSAGLAPIIIGNSILHVQRHGAHVRDLFYSLEKDGYAEHTWNDGTVTTAATCTEAGEEERTCTECGAKETAAVAPLGHDVAEGICALCGATFEATDADCFSFRELEDGSYAISDVAPGASLPADVVIPWEYNGKPVTAIDDMVGYEDASARTLLIPAGIVSRDYTITSDGRFQYMGEGDEPWDGLYIIG